MKKLLALLFVCVLCTSCTAAPPTPATSTPDSSVAQPNSTPEPLPEPVQQQFAQNATGFDITTAQVKGCTDGIATVQRNGAGYVDARGRLLRYEEMTEVNGAGAIIVRSGNKYGMVNKELELVIPVIYDAILQARSWGGGSSDDYVTPPIFYLFSGDSIYSLNWEKGLMATFSQSIDTPQYRYEDFSVVIAQGSLPFAYYHGELDCAIEWLMPGLKNTTFTLYSPTGETVSTATAQPIPNGYQDGLAIDFGGEEQRAAALGRVIALDLQAVSSEQLPAGILPDQASYIEGFRMPDGRFIVSYSFKSGKELFCRLVLADGDKITLLQEFKNATIGPPIDPKVLMCAQIEDMEYLYFAQLNMQGQHCVQIALQGNAS